LLALEFIEESIPDLRTRRGVEIFVAEEEVDSGCEGGVDCPWAICCLDNTLSVEDLRQGEDKSGTKNIVPE
jgi:hypothetical protein